MVSKMKVRALITVMGALALTPAFATEYIYNLGTLVLPNTTTTGAGTTQNFTPTSPMAIRGFYLSGNWTGTTSSASVVRVGLNNNAGWTTALAPQSGDRTTGGSTTTGAASAIGLYSNIYSNTTAPWNSNGDTLANGPTFSGNWTVNVRQGTATAGTYGVSSAALHVLTDAIAPMSGNLTANSPVYQRVTSVTGVGTGTLNAGTTFKYAVNTFIAPATGTFMVGSLTRDATGAQFDGWLSLYQGAFNPASPLTNIIGVDDDGGHGVGTSSTMFINLTAGQMYTAVQSTFSTTSTLTATGEFRVFVAGVPEPATMAVLGIGAVALLRRRRR